jgi:hypothetical protein
MVDSLNYIRKAIESNGSNAKVNVVRWEKDARTGYYNRPVKLAVTAHVALRELEKPLNKRSYVWRHIRPEGMTMDGNITAPTGNRLNDPALIEQMQAKIEQLEKELQEKPKRRRKAEDETQQFEPTIIESPETDEL